jgi:uncharacterized membrane protein YeaQ/YmgE (transglycosylase-associated protein family)
MLSKNKFHSAIFSIHNISGSFHTILLGSCGAFGGKIVFYFPFMFLCAIGTLSCSYKQILTSF